tara:strand:+ start:941 stop:1240 length:300 start_codon:yes stop_codon:yes gene_type:complete
MIGSDKNFYLKMVGIWGITDMPKLSAKFFGETVKFTCARGHIITMDTRLFDSLAPIEIVGLIDKKFEKNFGVIASGYRKDYGGFKQDPFSSQNKIIIKE